MTAFAVSPVEPDLEPIDSEDPRGAFRDRGFDKLEACYTPTRRLVINYGGHGLMSTVQECFANHRPLVLSPDHVWLCVSQAVGQHILDHAEKLRHKFVAHEGSRELEVRRDDFVRGGDNDWTSCLQTFSDALREVIGDKHEVFVNESSTTTLVERTASQIVMMGALQRYFNYTVGSLCGIPSITLEGTRDDWSNLIAKVDRLEGLDLDWWLPSLRQALTHFAKAAAGDAPEDVWRGFYKEDDASGGTYISGWVNALFPYVGDPGLAERNKLATEAPKIAFDGHRLKDYPNGLTHAPFQWRFVDAEFPMSFVAGFVGTTQDAQGALRPEIGWAIAPRALRRRFNVSTSWGTHPRLWPREPVEPDLLQHLDRETESLESYELALERRPVGDLSILVGKPKLHKLELHECKDLTSLDSLKGFTGEHLRITQCRELRDVRALSTMPNLKRFEMWHVPAVQDWSPVSTLRLELLSIFGKNLPEDCRGVHEGDSVSAVQKKLLKR